MPARTESERHGGMLAAEVLKRHGVPFLFTLCGGHISPILVACKQLGIRVVDVPRCRRPATPSSWWTNSTPPAR